MKTILVTTDFSAAAMNATWYAAEMASAIKADIFLLHVYQVPISYGEVPILIDHEQVIHDAEQQLFDIREQLLSKHYNMENVETEVKQGAFFPVLKKTCEDVNPYAVIMGSQGSSAVQRLLYGSNSVYALKHLKWPVIAVPANVKFSSIKKIGLACDYDKALGTIPLDEIKTLVNDFNATLYVLNTGKKDEFKPELIFESHLVHVLLKELKPNYHFITADDKDEGLMDFAEKNHLDLLIVFPKSHELLDRVIHTSHTKQLVLHCHVPVMALHHLPA